ncbi:MAG: FmdB family zinc ribbon protein [Candidatus Poribacteria bacterium]
MPLYEYQCKKCDRKFETLVNLSKINNPVECPFCGSKQTDKLISSFCASITTKTNISKPSCNLKGG